MIRITLYTRQDCTLCDQAVEDLNALQAEIAHELILVDVDGDPDLQAAYSNRVPVLKVGPYTLEAPFDRQKLRVTLGAARDRATQQETLGGDAYRKRVERGKTLSGGDKLTYWFTRHYLAVLNALIFLYVGLSFLAPVLMSAGMPALARPIYAMYSTVCHQLAFRSWFLFGEQPVYPRQAAGIEGAISYGEATGQDEEDLFTARSFVGDERMGYKVAYCQRDVAIYGSMLLFGLVYALTRRRLPALPWYLWFAIGILPIALDGFSQLLSQIPGFSLWAYRESTPLLRTLTGGLFGFTTAWFGFPLVEESMADARLLIASKIASLKGSESG